MIYISAVVTLSSRTTTQNQETLLSCDGWLSCCGLRGKQCISVSFDRVWPWTVSVCAWSAAKQLMQLFNVEFQLHLSQNSRVPAEVIQAWRDSTDGPSRQVVYMLSSCHLMSVKGVTLLLFLHNDSSHQSYCHYCLNLVNREIQVEMRH